MLMDDGSRTLDRRIDKAYSEGNLAELLGKSLTERTRTLRESRIYRL